MEQLVEPDFELPKLTPPSVLTAKGHTMITFKPKIVIIEFNHLIPNEVDFIQKKDFEYVHIIALCYKSPGKLIVKGMKACETKS